MPRTATPIQLDDEELQTLRQWVRSAAQLQRLANRAAIILRAAEKQSTRQIAKTLGITAAQVSKWRTRFSAKGLSGLQDAERSGKPRTYTNATESRILALVAQPPPGPHALWTGPLLAQAVGHVSVDYVWRVLRAHGIALRRANVSLYGTRPPIPLRSVTISGVFLSHRCSAFLIGNMKGAAALPGLVFDGYLRAPDRVIAGMLRRHFGGTPGTLTGTLQYATGLAKAGRYSAGDSRHLDDFLLDALSYSNMSDIHAFIVGAQIAPQPRLHPHSLSTFEAWRNSLASWLSVFFSPDVKAAGREVTDLLPAVEGFVAARCEPEQAPFEWFLLPFGRQEPAASAPSSDV